MQFYPRYRLVVIKEKSFIVDYSVALTSIPEKYKAFDLQTGNEMYMSVTEMVEADRFMAITDEQAETMMSQAVGSYEYGG